MEKDAVLRKLVSKWNNIKNKELKLKKEKEAVRHSLIVEVDKRYPDKKRSARIEIGKFNVIRSAATKLVWDLAKLKKVVGERIYGQIINVKETVNEKVLDEKINAGLIVKADAKKACKAEYSERLLVNLKKENEEEKFSVRRLVEVMNH